MLTIEPLEQKNKKLTYIIFIAFIVVAGVFLYIAEQYEKSPLTLERKVKNSLYFKLSAEDIVDLNNSIDTNKWVSVKLITAQQNIISAKLRHKENSIMDYQLYINGEVYNLFHFDDERKYVHDFYKTAKNWGLRSTTTQLVKIKLNEILFGIYIMEKKIYEKIRDSRGNYFISLGSNTIGLKTLLYLIPNVNPNLVEKYFNKKKLAAYFIFFSLFSYNEIFEFDNMLLYYNTRTKMYQPYLTLDSILTSLFEQDISFKLHIGEAKNFFVKMTRENINNLLYRADNYQFGELIKIVLR